MSNKISTSVQYQFTNVYLFDLVFKRWATFNKDLTKGSKYIKNNFCLEWDRLKKVLENKPNVEVKDLDREVTPGDFDVTVNHTKGGKIIFFFKFPDYKYFDAASKCVALALMKDTPRYFTFEYSKNSQTKEKQFVIGEFYMDNNVKKHKNYGATKKDDLAFFANFIIKLLNKEED